MTWACTLDFVLLKGAFHCTSDKHSKVYIPLCFPSAVTVINVSHSGRRKWGLSSEPPVTMTAQRPGCATGSFSNHYP